MSTKHVITGVHRVDEGWVDSAESFYAEISLELSARIIELAALVAERELFDVSFFDYNGTWSSLIIEQVDDEVMSDHRELIEHMCTTECNVRADVPMLHIMSDSFKWTAVPKHCGDDMEMRSHTIPLHFLKGDETHYLSIE